MALRAGYSDAQMVVRSPSMAEVAGHLSGLAEELVAADLGSTSSRDAMLMGGKLGGMGGGGGDASRWPTWRLEIEKEARARLHWPQPGPSSQLKSSEVHNEATACMSGMERRGGGVAEEAHG